VVLDSIFVQPLGQQFSDLAQGFLRGHLYLWHTHYSFGFDPVLYNHHQYWDEGGFPAITLLPFSAIFLLFHKVFYQQYLQWVFILGVAYFVYGLARRFRYSKEDSLILSFAFTLGSVFVGVSLIASSWDYAQVVTTFLLFGSLYEYFMRRRWWLIGVLCGCVFLTRATAAPIVIFFALEIWSTSKLNLKKYLPVALPMAGAIGLQALYNFLRFHSPLNGGYQYQLLEASSAESRALGVFSVKHIPANAYALLLSPPQTVTSSPTTWTLTFPYIRSNSDGISIFMTSPYLLSLFSRKWASFDKTARHLLVAVLFSCLAVLCFYGIGRTQFGYRYSLDFLPELFVVFMMTYRVEHQRLSRGMKFLLLASGIFNFYILLTYV
jgi:hypothetical protein